MLLVDVVDAAEAAVAGTEEPGRLERGERVDEEPRWRRGK